MDGDFGRRAVIDDPTADDVDLVAALGKETSPALRVEIARIREEADLHLSRDFRYGPISATVAASTAQTVPSVSSFTLPDSLMAVLLTKPETCAAQVLLGWSL
jgi:hypothetical protein